MEQAAVPVAAAEDDAFDFAACGVADGIGEVHGKDLGGEVAGCV